MLRLSACVLVPLALVVVAGCSDDEPSGDGSPSGSGAGAGAGQGGGSPAGTGGSSTGGGSASGGGGSGGCEADLESDPANCGTCGHDCLGGACLEGACQPVVLSDVFGDSPLATDGSWVYWVDTETATLMRVATGGGEPASVADVGAIYGIADMVAAGGRVVLSGGKGSEGALLLSVDPASGTVTTLFESTDSDFWNGNFAADATHAYLVETEFLSIPLAGGAPKSLDASSDVTFYYRNAVTVDGTHVYLAAHGYSGQGDALFRVAKGGGNEEIIAELEPDAMVPGPSGLVAMVSPFSSDSCAGTTTLQGVGASGQLTSVASFAGWSVNLHADATHAYFTRYCDYDIARVPLAGGGQPELVWGEISNNASRFAADAEALYLWSSTPSGLVKLAK